MQDYQKLQSEINNLGLQALSALDNGQEQHALKLFGQILKLDPNNLPTINELGLYALKTGELGAAIDAFQRVILLDGSKPQQWVNLAAAYRSLKEEKKEEDAIKKALDIDPMDLQALIMLAELLARQGQIKAAAMAHGAIIKVAPPIEKLHPSLHDTVRHSFKYKSDYDTAQAEFLDQFLSKYYENFNDTNLNRFKNSVDILVNRKKRYESQSSMYHYPNLSPIEFFDRDQFPWLPQIEENSDQIKNEFIEILRADKGFTPYLEYPNGVPLNQFAELNNSLNWSSFHLYKNGKLQEENSKKCPITMELLKLAPQPIQLERTPTAMFSLLQPKTHIPPHTGVSNVRLLTHIPLIIPEDCGFRVGNQVRFWEYGKALVFDDTIEHEAWNRSDKLRVILIFDIWHPELTLVEREMITHLSQGLESFQRSLVSSN